MTTSDSITSTVQSVDRALGLLDVLALSLNGMTLTELHKAVDLDISISTVHRLMSTLLAWGYVDQDPSTKVFTLGSQIINLGSIAMKQINLGRIPRRFLQELGSVLNEHVNLVKLVDNRAVYIDQVQAEQRSIRMFTQIGANVPLYCTGVGKAMIAFLSEDKYLRLIETEPLKSFTVNTITNLIQLKEELAGIRKRGYAIYKD